MRRCRHTQPRRDTPCESSRTGAYLESEGLQHRTVSSRLTGTILNLLFDGFLFQFLQLSSQLLGLIAKLVDALCQGGTTVSVLDAAGV